MFARVWSACAAESTAAEVRLPFYQRTINLAKEMPHEFYRRPKAASGRGQPPPRVAAQEREGPKRGKANEEGSRRKMVIGVVEGVKRVREG